MFSFTTSDAAKSLCMQQDFNTVLMFLSKLKVYGLFSKSSMCYQAVKKNKAFYLEFACSRAHLLMECR